MIDIHHHCLPGIDDGPRDWDSAVRQVRLAAEEGIETIVATPHVLRGPWQNDSPRELQKLVLELNHRIDGKPRVLLGSEFFFSHDVLELLDRGEPVIPLAGSRFILLEFASMSVPPRIETILHEMKLRDWIPVIAHPERNLVLQTKLDLLSGLVRYGVRIQLTASSLEGAFGPAARRSAFEMLDREMVHFIATDAHSIDRRPPVVAAARRIVESRWGPERAVALFDSNPRAVVDQTPLPYDPEPHEASANLWSRIVERFLR